MTCDILTHGLIQENFAGALAIAPRRGYAETYRDETRLELAALWRFFYSRGV